jgi:hypothetical protein
MSNTINDLSFFGIGIVKSVDDFPKITMYDRDFRNEIFVMHQVITNLNYWYKLKDFEPGKGGFMFCEDPDWITQIRTDPNVEKCYHSRATIAMAFMIMECIAKEGWSKFYEKYNLNFFGVGIVNSVNDLPKGITDADFREYIFGMHQSITKLGYWNKLQVFEPGEGGFMFCDNQMIYDIMNDPIVKSHSHSGASMAVTFRAIEVIAKEGWTKFCSYYFTV